MNFEDMKQNEFFIIFAFCMDKKKLTREEALRRWNASKELKRKMSEKLERLVRESCKGRDDNGTVSVEVW